jgi:hypothetical protein
LASELDDALVDDTPPQDSEPPSEESPLGRRAALAAIFAISLAGLLLEVAYTRVISYKLWYYYTYLVIGLALLGIGSGATLVVVSRRLRAASTRGVLRWASILGALSVVVGYAVVARVPVDTLALWDYGTGASAKNFAVLGLICFVLFASFVSIGIMVATLLGRGGDQIGKLYFADLIGAGIGCAIVVFLVSRLGPPSVIMLAATVLAATGLALSLRSPVGVKAAAGAVLALLVLLTVAGGSLLPTLRPEAAKMPPPEDGFDYSDWGPVFRVDVEPVTGRDDLQWLIHDGTWGSAIHKFDGDPESLTRFDSDPRSWPFNVLGEPARESLIIGSAGGNEILASLYHDSESIDAVELNPVTVGIVRKEYVDYTGDITSFDQVHLTQGDGRTFLARSDKAFDLIWFVAPDSYAANNAASSGAFVLSESYLYTVEMIEESLSHLSDEGISVAQFGEVDFANRPNRTSRYLVSARQALENMGVEDPSQHILVATSTDPLSGGLSTIMVKRTPFTPEEITRFQEAIPNSPDSKLVYAPGVEVPDSVAGFVAGAASPEEVEEIIAAYEYDISAVTDDAPFFWHFRGFDEVAGEMTHSASAVDRENAIGERVLLLLLGIAAAFAVVFLLLPFLVIRREWKALPAKGISAVYFALLGLGFMLFEITMIQKLTEYLGYPTYSLTVTLASILVFTGFGALWSNRFAASPSRILPVLLGVLAALTLFYRFVLPEITESTLDAPFAVRALVAFLVLAPLGLCLGMFMPLGLRTVGALSTHADEYVAWGWAINGVFSVIGSVLTTILSMSWGFRTVQLLALVAYLGAGAAFLALRKVKPRTAEVDLRDASAAESPSTAS